MGVHTGDSIVVAPIQTLPDTVVQRLRRCALKIVRALELEGGCNVQLAVSADGSDYRVIEVNPRVSRSSALASKATGYPIARIAALIALGRRLHELPNPATGGNSAAFEPAVDYVVVKLPRWPFDKFPTADRSLGVQMKATGEAMAIDREFGPALLKAIRSLEPRGRGWLWEDPAWELSHRGPDDLVRFLAPTDTRLWRMIALLRHSWSDAAQLAAATGIAPWFTERLAELVEAERRPGRLVPRGCQARWLRRRGHRDHVGRAVGRHPPRAGALRHSPRLPSRRHLRGRVPRRDAVLLLELRRCRGRAARRTPERHRGRVGTDQDRAGDRVRLLQRARSVGRSRDGARCRRHQQQPRDRVDRLRRLHAPLLRAARHGERARRDRPRARADRHAADGGAHVRGSDRHRPRQGSRLRGRADCRPDRRRDRDHRGSRALRRASSTSWGSRGRAARSPPMPTRWGRRSRRSGASPSSCDPRG